MHNFEYRYVYLYLYTYRSAMLELKYEKHGSTIVDMTLLWLWWVMHTDLEKVGYVFIFT